jgi:hypothetical protein
MRALREKKEKEREAKRSEEMAEMLRVQAEMSVSDLKTIGDLFGAYSSERARPSARQKAEGHPPPWFDFDWFLMFDYDLAVDWCVEAADAAQEAARLELWRRENEVSKSIRLNELKKVSL